MSVSFDGSAHQYVALSAGTLGAVGTGAYTIVLLFRPTNTPDEGPITMYSGSITGTEERLILGDSGHWFGASDFTAGFSTWSVNTWYLLGQSKAAGSNPYRWHYWTYAADGSGTKTHADSATSHVDGSTVAAIRLGDENAKKYWGEIALAAVWKRALSDADFNALCGSTAKAFMTLGTGAPDALWLCNVSNPASIVDATGHGANATGVVGTGITAGGADPHSFNYDLSIPVPWFKM